MSYSTVKPVNISWDQTVPQVIARSPKEHAWTVQVRSKHSSLSIFFNPSRYLWDRSRSKDWIENKTLIETISIYHSIIDTLLMAVLIQVRSSRWYPERMSYTIQEPCNAPLYYPVYPGNLCKNPLLPIHGSKIIGIYQQAQIFSTDCNGMVKIFAFLAI